MPWFVPVTVGKGLDPDADTADTAGSVHDVLIKGKLTRVKTKNLSK